MEEDKGKEVEKRVPATIMAPEASLVPIVKKNPVVLPYGMGISEQSRSVFRSFDMPTYFKLTNTFGHHWCIPRTRWRRGKW